MRVLITGAAGFIGSALISRLFERGDEVAGIDNRNDFCGLALKEAHLVWSIFLRGLCKTPRIP